MRKWIILGLFFGMIFTCMAQEDEKPYEFEEDSLFQFAKPLAPVSATGYDRQDCVFANRMVRTMVNRFRATSFQMERRCRERGGKGLCEKHVAHMDNIVSNLNRQFELIKAKCVQR